MQFGSHGADRLPALLTARQLTTRILPAPYGYEIDPTPHASGAITRALFDQFGGVRSPSKFGFVAGFKQNYVNPGTEEGLIVTVMEFKSSRDASAYFTQTRPSTLSYAGATLKPFPGVPGAFEAEGTKSYNHGYYHAIVDTANNFYFQVVVRSPRTVIGASRARTVGRPGVHGPQVQGRQAELTGRVGSRLPRD